MPRSTCNGRIRPSLCVSLFDTKGVLYAASYFGDDKETHWNQALTVHGIRHRNVTAEIKVDCGGLQPWSSLSVGQDHSEEWQLAQISQYRRV